MTVVTLEAIVVIAHVGGRESRLGRLHGRIQLQHALEVCRRLQRGYNKQAALYCNGIGQHMDRVYLVK
jgi:hypothetical protein